VKKFFAGALLAATITLPAQGQTPVKAATGEVLLDLVVRDKKGKPINDLKPEDITVLDNGTKQSLTSFRRVSGAEAITSAGAAEKLDPLRQVRLLRDLDRAYARRCDLRLHGSHQRAFRHCLAAGDVPALRVQPVVDIALKRHDATGESEHHEEQPGSQTNP